TNLKLKNYFWWILFILNFIFVNYKHTNSILHVNNNRPNYQLRSCNAHCH
ncbi:unnamed protein product, partial [Plutella xylostella]